MQRKDPQSAAGSVITTRDGQVMGLNLEEDEEHFIRIQQHDLERAKGSREKVAGDS